MGLNVDSHRRHTGPLRRLRSANERVLLQLEHRLDQIGGSVRETNAPAGHGIRFRKTFDDDRSRIKLRRRDERSVVTKPVVDFIADQGDVVLRRQFGQPLHFFLGRHDAGRIRRAIKQYRLGFAGNGGAHAIQIDRKFWIRFDEHRAAAHQLHERLVSNKVRIEQR